MVVGLIFWLRFDQVFVAQLYSLPLIVLAFGLFVSAWVYGGRGMRRGWLHFAAGFRFVFDTHEYGCEKK